MASVPRSHIHSSLLNDLRVPVKTAQEQLGHASISTTLSIYAHVVDASHPRCDRSAERIHAVVRVSCMRRQRQLRTFYYR